MNIFWYTVDSAYFPLRLNSRSQFLFLVVFNNFFFIFCLIIWHLLNLSKQRRSLVAYPVDGNTFSYKKFPLRFVYIGLFTCTGLAKPGILAGENCIKLPIVTQQGNILLAFNILNFQIIGLRNCCDVWSMLIFIPRICEITIYIELMLLGNRNFIWESCNYRSPNFAQISTWKKSLKALNTVLPRKKCFI